MNISGSSVAAALRKTKLSPGSLIVIQDSLNHNPASLSPRFGGSSNGHKGVRSVIDSVGTQSFLRLRIGIGRPDSDIVEYVLGRLSSYEKEYWGPDGEGTDRVW